LVHRCIFEGGDAAQHVRPRGRGRVAGPTPADLAAVAGQLERVIAEGEPQKTKALLRLLSGSDALTAERKSSPPTGSSRATFAQRRRRGPSSHGARDLGRVIPVAARRLVLDFQPPWDYTPAAGVARG
jgi:hypothetical protein